jgi:hypothetical protein
MESQAGGKGNSRAWDPIQRHKHSRSNLKYSSRFNPLVRRLFLMMKTGTALYLGMTTGRNTPCFVKTIWSPSVRTQWNPARSKMQTSTLYETGLIFGIGQRHGYGDATGCYELWTFKFVLVLFEARFLQYLAERAVLLSLF